MGKLKFNIGNVAFEFEGSTEDDAKFLSKIVALLLAKDSLRLPMQRLNLLNLWKVKKLGRV
jgi:hypothetical protein